MYLTRASIIANTSLALPGPRKLPPTHPCTRTHAPAAAPSRVQPRSSADAAGRAYTHTLAPAPTVASSDAHALVSHAHGQTGGEMAGVAGRHWPVKRPGRSSGACVPACAARLSTHPPPQPAPAHTPHLQLRMFRPARVQPLPRSFTRTHGWTGWKHTGPPAHARPDGVGRVCCAARAAVRKPARAADRARMRAADKPRRGQEAPARRTARAWLQTHAAAAGSAPTVSMSSVWLIRELFGWGHWTWRWGNSQRCEKVDYQDWSPCQPRRAPSTGLGHTELRSEAKRTVSHSRVEPSERLAEWNPNGELKSREQA
ncbi:hypothetical protein GGX14DRAFT_607876 [Mycena pura]|uniref:Uncharacterized protein n=1 Tax=Mycena pura TaxID=153505 RepID=A0AAD6XZD9_9AGAR|nr:hypothetical protein GGX14DRAFT_607876 [Mycena pura]